MLAYFMFRYHPVQQAYFNELVSRDKDYLRQRYEMEYWGCVYKQGLEYLLEHDKSDSIRVFWSLPPVINNVMMLPAEQRGRFVLVSRGEYPYYFITNYRGMTHPRNRDRFDRPFAYHFDVLNNTVLGVYHVTGD
jgi:hypothetical protein